MTATTPSPPHSVPGTRRRLVDYRDAQRILRALRAGPAEMPVPALLLAGGVAMAAAVALLVAVLPSADRGWTGVAEGPNGAWQVAVRADADGTSFLALGTELFARSTVGFPDPSPERSVRAAPQTVGDDTLMLGVAAPHVSAVQVTGAGAGSGDVLAEVVEGPGAAGIFVAALDPGADISAVRVEAHSADGEIVGSWPVTELAGEDAG